MSVLQTFDTFCKALTNGLLFTGSRDSDSLSVATAHMGPSHRVISMVPHIVILYFGKYSTAVPFTGGVNKNIW